MSEVKSFNRYFVRKYVRSALDCRDDSVKAKSEEFEKLLESNQVLTFCYFPLYVYHNAYDIAEVADLCSVFLEKDIEQACILDFPFSEFSSTRQVKLNSLVANSLQVFIEDRSLTPRVRKRIPLWYSKFDSSGELVASELAKLKTLTLRVDSSQPVKEWTIVNIKTSRVDINYKVTFD